MKKMAVAFLVFLGIFLGFSPSGSCAYEQVTTVSALMKVLEEEKQQSVYNVDLNAPFTKENSGIRESISTESGEVIVTNTIFHIPGRNGMDLSLRLDYRSRDAKLYEERTISDSDYTYGEIIIAFYDVYDEDNGYWLRTGALKYPAHATIRDYVNIGSEDWFFTGYLQELDGTSVIDDDIDIANHPGEKSLVSAAKYVFGEGWSLNIPSLDVRGYEDDPVVFVHLPNGQTYQADFIAGAGLKDYELTDVVFTEDDSLSNGTDESAYKLYYANGYAYYFSAKGELLCEMDRFQNSIRYYWESINEKRLLTKIVDSVGHVVKIQYHDTATTFSSGTRTVVLIKSPVPGVSGKYYLSSFRDAAGREIRYKYTFPAASFDALGEDPTDNVYANLIEILYPTGAKTCYVYEKAKKNLGISGFMEYFKVKQRWDTMGENIINKQTYLYFNEPDGYPLYKGDDIDELYQYYSKVIDSQGLSTKYWYNSKHLPYLKQQYTDRLLRETRTQYHSGYHLPIKDIIKTYNDQGNIFEKWDMYQYDHRGNIVFENHPDSIQGEISDERAVAYTYDYQYNLLTGQKYKQDKDTTIEIKYSLSSDKRKIESETAAGNGKVLVHKEYVYDDSGNLIRETIEKEPGEWVTARFEYGSQYQGAYLTAVVNEDVEDADGHTKDHKIEFTYDFNTGNRLSETDGNGNTASYEYDALDRLIKEQLPDKSVRAYKYDDSNNILEVSNANRHRLIYQYDGFGKLKSVKEPGTDATLVQLAYDENENLISETDGNRNIKKLSYDQLTRIIGVSHRDKTGQVLAETGVSYDEAYYDKFGMPFFKVTVTRKGDTQNRVANYYFDIFDRLVELGRFNKGTEEFSVFQYDYLGSQTKAVNFAGEKALFTYDGLGRLLTSTDGAGGIVTYRYDRLGNLLSQKDPVGHTVYFSYDQLGRKLTEKSPFETGSYSEAKYYYDGAGNLVKAVDPEGFATKYHFNNRNLLSAVEQIISENESQITKVEYDGEGNTTKIIKGLSSWEDPQFTVNSYQYDVLDRLTESTDGGNRKTQYRYDLNGNLIQMTDRNNIIVFYAYDGLNRLVAKENSKDGEKNRIQFTFDQLGQNRQITDETGTTIFHYDDLGRLITVYYGNGIRQYYAYDNADRVNNLQVMQGSLSQINLTYRYDKAGRLTEVNDQGKRFTYQYDQAGKLIREQNGVTGIQSDYRYYPSGNIRSLRHSLSNNTISFYEYRYDRRGNQIEKNEGTGTTKYYYDSLSRIKTAVQPDSILSYEYHDLNNIKEIAEINGTKISQTTYTYDHDSRLLLQETDQGSELIQQRFTYDGEGNQLTKEEVIKRNGGLVSSTDYQFWWNGFNQVERVRDPDGQFIDYKYNGLGLRTKKDFGDQGINYFYDQGNIILETDWNMMVTARNIRGKRLIYRETSDDTLFYLHNAHGDVTQLVDEFGQVVKDYRYDPFGNEDSIPLPAFGGSVSRVLWQQEIETIDNPFRYCGEYLDEETGNYYLRARYYDPSIGRFISEDSNEGQLTNPLSLNLYTYCWNNPGKYIDYSGNNPAAVIYMYVTAVASSPDTQMDMQCIALDLSQGNYFAAAFDSAGVLIPGVTGLGKTADNVASRVLKFFGRKSRKEIDITKQLFGNGQVVMSYKNLKSIVKGTGLETHHLIEKRFADALKINPNDILSIAIDKKTHEQITNLMRAKIPYNSIWKRSDDLMTRTATPQQIWDATRDVYKELGLTQYLDPLKQQLINAGTAKYIKDWGKW